MRKGKEKTKDKVESSKEDAEGDRQANAEEMTAQQVPNSKKSMKLAVQVMLLANTGEEPSAISGVESILKSYVERTPCAEWEDRVDDFAQQDRDAPVPDAEPTDESNRAPNVERGDEEEEEEEKFHETFFATLARTQANAPRTPSTVKNLSLDLASGDNAESIPASGDSQRSRLSTPRPVPARSSHSLPTLLPIMQRLLAGVEGARSDPDENVLGVRTDLQGAREGYKIDNGAEHVVERLYSRANSPPILPPFPRRTTSLTAPIEPDHFPTSPELPLSPSIGATYREFHFLINVLERWRRNGHDCPLRSLIGIEFSSEVFAQIGATSFKDYVQRAVAAGVVTVGGGLVQGREWITLNREWQGLGLVME